MSYKTGDALSRRARRCRRAFNFVGEMSIPNWIVYPYYLVIPLVTHLYSIMTTRTLLCFQFPELHH